MKTSSFLAAALCVALAAGAAIPAPLWNEASPGHRWEFPRDHWSHPGYRTEWWYFTGQLATAEAEEIRFGYQFTFFRVGLVPQLPDWDSEWTSADIIMGHAAITDLQEERHRFSELVYRATPFLGEFSAPGDSPIAWSQAPPGSAGRWTLGWNGNGFDIAMHDDTHAMALELRTAAPGPPVLQGRNGWSRKSADGSASSLYYSFPRLASSGTVLIDGETFVVRGVSWMDKEFGSSQLAEGQVGWDWMSLRLEDGRSLMLYSLRRADGSSDWRSGTLVDGDGSARYLTASDWSLTVERTWKSPESGADYPAGWSLEVPMAALRVEITPDLEDQENRSRILPGLFYWEGSVSITRPGRGRIGRGYVELTGYGQGSRPPHLTHPRPASGRGPVFDRAAP